MKKNKKAFTLVELLAVIVILGILALITVPLILNTVENARISAMKISAKNYFDALIQAIDINKTKAGFPERMTGGCYTIKKIGDQNGVENFADVQGNIPIFDPYQDLCVRNGKINNDIYFNIDNYYGKYIATTDKVEISKTDDWNGTKCSGLGVEIVAKDTSNDNLTNNEWTYKNATLTATPTCNGEVSEGTYIYQWYKDGIKINKANTSTLSVTETGDYSVYVRKSGETEKTPEGITFSYKKDTTSLTCTLVLSGTKDDSGDYISNVDISLNVPISSGSSGLSYAISESTTPTYNNGSVNEGETVNYSYSSTQAGVNKKYYGYVKTGAGKTAQCETTFTRKSYTGLPSGTYATGDTVNYAGIDWIVIKDNGNNTTLVKKTNYTTGAFGSTASFAAGNNAYDKVNTNFINDNNALKTEVNNGAVKTDSTSNSFVRLPMQSELSTNIKNYSNTNFWTMTANGDNLYYGLPNGGKTYTQYSVSQGSQNYYYGKTKDVNNLLNIKLNHATSTSISDPTALYSKTNAIYGSYYNTIYTNYMSTNVYQPTTSKPYSVSSNYTDIGDAPAFTGTGCTASGPTGSGTTRYCTYTCTGGGYSTTRTFDFAATTGSFEYCDGDDGVKSFTYNIPAISITATGTIQYIATTGPYTATKTTSGAYGTTVTYSCPAKSSISFPAGSGPKQFACSSNCSQNAYGDNYYAATTNDCTKRAEDVANNTTSDMGIRPVITVREK